MKFEKFTTLASKVKDIPRQITIFYHAETQTNDLFNMLYFAIVNPLLRNVVAGFLKCVRPFYDIAK